MNKPYANYVAPNTPEMERQRAERIAVDICEITNGVTPKGEVCNGGSMHAILENESKIRLTDACAHCRARVACHIGRVQH